MNAKFYSEISSLECYGKFKILYMEKILAIDALLQENLLSFDNKEVAFISESGISLKVGADLDKGDEKLLKSINAKFYSEKSSLDGYGKFIE